MSRSVARILEGLPRAVSVGLVPSLPGLRASVAEFDALYFVVEMRTAREETMSGRWGMAR